MSADTYEIGDMVVLTREGWLGYSAVVSAPVKPGKDGHVLLLSEGHLEGVSVAVEEITPADDAALGFAQLASTLIKLGSHVIEKRIIKLV